MLWPNTFPNFEPCFPTFIQRTTTTTEFLNTLQYTYFTSLLYLNTAPPTSTVNAALQEAQASCCLVWRTGTSMYPLSVSPQTPVQIPDNLMSSKQQCQHVHRDHKADCQDHSQGENILSSTLPPPGHKCQTRKGNTHSHSSHLAEAPQGEEVSSNSSCLLMCCIHSLTCFTIRGLSHVTENICLFHMPITGSSATVLRLRFEKLKCPKIFTRSLSGLRYTIRARFANDQRSQIRSLVYSTDIKIVTSQTSFSHGVRFRSSIFHWLRCCRYDGVLFFWLNSQHHRSPPWEALLTRIFLSLLLGVALSFSIGLTRFLIFSIFVHRLPSLAFTVCWIGTSCMMLCIVPFGSRCLPRPKALVPCQKSFEFLCSRFMAVNTDRTPGLY